MGRRAWGSAVPRARPSSASRARRSEAPTQPESVEDAVLEAPSYTGGIVARYPLTQLRRESLQNSAARVLSNGKSVTRGTLQLPPLPKAGGSGYSAGATAAAVAAVSRERAAVDADDAMALLLDDYFSDEEDSGDAQSDSAEDASAAEVVSCVHKDAQCPQSCPMAEM